MQIGLQVPSFTWPGGPAEDSARNVTEPAVFELFAEPASDLAGIVPAGR